MPYTFFVASRFASVLANRVESIFSPRRYENSNSSFTAKSRRFEANPSPPFWRQRPLLLRHSNVTYCQASSPRDSDAPHGSSSTAKIIGETNNKNGKAFYKNAAAEIIDLPVDTTGESHTTDSPSSKVDAVVFSTGENRTLAAEICSYLGIPIGRSNCSTFADGEIKIKITDEVRGRDVFVVHSSPCPCLGKKPDSAMIKLLLFLSTLRRSSAHRVTAVLPYCAYFRQTGDLGGFAGLGAADVARLMLSAGVSRVVFVDIHAKQAEAFFGDNIPVTNVTSYDIVADHFKRNKSLINPVVVSIGSMGTERTNSLWSVMQKLGVVCGLATVFVTDQGRSGTETASASFGTSVSVASKNCKNPRQLPLEVVGNVKDCDCILVSDILNTGRDLVTAAQHLKKAGARRVLAFASHGLFGDLALKRIDESELEEVVITNSVALPKGLGSDKLRVLSLGRVLGEVINRIHFNKSVEGMSLLTDTE